MGANINVKTPGGKWGTRVSESTTVASSVSDPSEVTLEGTVAGSAAEVAATLTDVTPYNIFVIHVIAVTTSIDITVSLDGTDFSGNVVLIDQSTEAPFATAAITAAGVYKLQGKFKSIKITSVGAGAYDANYLLGTQ